MKLIVGLGNPGKQYDRTRHNVGFLVCDALVRYDENGWMSGQGPFEISRSPFQKCSGVAIVKPMLFMNESGRAVKAALDQFQVASDQCLVVVDDVNLPVGTIRFRNQGSAGGHHGLESIIEVLGTANFSRLHIGIGTTNLSGQDLTGYVLDEFSEKEWQLIVPHIERARDACLEWVQSDAQTVMQRYN